MLKLTDAEVQAIQGCARMLVKESGEHEPKEVGHMINTVLIAAFHRNIKDLVTDGMTSSVLTPEQANIMIGRKDVS